MVRLLGRKVERVCGALFPVDFGVVYADNPEGVWVRFENGAREYYAKWRLLCNEYAECERPDAVGIYLIAENV